jgi:hypothetical protein
MPKLKGRGRRKGSRNKGYFFREGRGWFTKDGGTFVHLTDENGNRLKNRRTDDAVVKAAYHRWSSEKARATAASPKRADDAVTVSHVCMAYLAKAKSVGAKKTFELRNDSLWTSVGACRPSSDRATATPNGCPRPLIASIRDTASWRFRSCSRCTSTSGCSPTPNGMEAGGRTFRPSNGRSTMASSLA